MVVRLSNRGRRVRLPTRSLKVAARRPRRAGPARAVSPRVPPATGRNSSSASPLC